MRASLRESLCASPSLRDLRILVEAAIVILCTWLLLHWDIGRAITQADGSWLVVPYTDSVLHAGGDWTRHLYRFGVLGGSEMHAFGGTTPLVQIAAWLGLSTTATVNASTIFVQLAYAFFGLRLAEALAHVWCDQPRHTTAAQRVIAVWLVGFAPLLGNRLAVGHENLLLGFLPLFVIVSLVWQARAQRASGIALCLAVFAIANGVSGLGAQGLIYSALFGVPLVIASTWGWKDRAWPLVEIALVGLAGILIMLPRLIPMIEHALGPDATRAVGASVTTSYGAAPLRDWLTSLAWTIGDRAAGTVHEHNYPIGPPALMLAVAWPAGRSRRLAWTMLATLVIAMLFASEVRPVSTLLQAGVPLLDAFRGPSRATLAVLLFVPPVAVGCWLAREPGRSPGLMPWAGVVVAGLLVLSLRGTTPWAREIAAWLLTAVGIVALVTDPRSSRPHAVFALAAAAGLGVLAFDERFPRQIPHEPIEGIPYKLRAAVAPELGSHLDRIVITDPPPPYDMSTALAARLPSIDGIWYPPPRFLWLLSTLTGRPLPATTAVFRLSRSPQFPILQQLYNVRASVRGLASGTPEFHALPPTPGPAWFPATISTAAHPGVMLDELRTAHDLRATLTRAAWVEPGVVAPGCLDGRVIDVTTDPRGERASISVHVPAPCTLVVATNYTTTLVARGTVGPDIRPLEVIPINIALTGIVVPAGTTHVTLGPAVPSDRWSNIPPWLALLGLIAVFVRRAVRDRRPRLGLAAAVLLGTVACSSRGEPAQKHEPTPIAAEPSDAASPPARPGTSVLIVMIDSMRADRLGAAGYRRKGQSLTPELDAFASTATRFTRAYAHAPNTPRSFPSLVSSRLPSRVSYHQQFHNFSAVLDENVLLFEVLAAAGLHTASFSSHFYFEPRRGLAQGVVEYDNRDARDLRGSNLDHAAPRVVPRAIHRLEELARERRTFAMFVHLFEPHSTYIEHPEYPTSERGEAGLVERYDYEIAVVDGWVGKLLATLDRTGLAEDTLVVVLSDHGEAFGVHSYRGQRAFFHGQTLYDEVLRVPLLVRVPNHRPGVRDDVVGLIDVAPTILDALGLASPETFEGRTLMPLVRGERLPPRDVRAELLPTPGLDDRALALIGGDGHHKLILAGPDQRAELYDLGSDPDERKNLANRSPEVVTKLRAALENASPKR
jgi:arylsulfatase A-like enzyme